MIKPADSGPKKTAERVARAKKLRADGWNWRRIALEMGVSPCTVHAWCSEEYRLRQLAHKALKKEPEKPATKKTPRSNLDPVVAHQVLELKARGYRAQAIAAVLHIPYRLVEEALR
jgi:DNA invertase Pin-like site-specific DNA recombinase